MEIEEITGYRQGLEIINNQLRGAFMSPETRAMYYDLRSEYKLLLNGQKATGPVQIAELLQIAMESGLINSLDPEVRDYLFTELARGLEDGVEIAAESFLEEPDNIPANLSDQVGKRIFAEQGGVLIPGTADAAAESEGGVESTK